MADKERITIASVQGETMQEGQVAELQLFGPTTESIEPQPGSQPEPFTSETHTIVGTNPTGDQAGGVTEIEFAETCSYPPASQGADAWDRSSRRCSFLRQRQGCEARLRALDETTLSGAFIAPAGFAQLRGLPRPADVYDSANDPATAKRLWELTEQVLGSPLDSLSGLASMNPSK
jgi:hypothetical protein